MIELTNLGHLLFSLAFFALASCIDGATQETPTALAGKWLGSYVSKSEVGSNGVECTDGFGGFIIQRGRLSGEATNPYGVSYTVTGQVIGATRIEGRFNYRGQTVGTFEGELINGRLEGTFGDADDCMGNWSAVRE